MTVSYKGVYTYFLTLPTFSQYSIISSLLERSFTPHNYDMEFKINAVQHYEDHKVLELVGCASNLDIPKASLSNWRKGHANIGDIKVIESVD